MTLQSSMITSCAACLIDIMEPEVSTPTSLPTSLRFRCSNMLVPGQWHHLVVVMAKDVKKSCMTSVYFNGKAFGSGKVLTKNTGGAVYHNLKVCHSSQLFPFCAR